MGSFILENRDNLSEFHYIRKARAVDFWFDISIGKLKNYITQYGDKFCVVLFGSEEIDHCYILPFDYIKDLFKNEFLYDETRWMGSISKDLLRIRNSGRTISVTGYYNAFELLTEEDNGELGRSISEAESLYHVENEIELIHLEDYVAKFNEMYQGATPRKRLTISNRIARPNAITDFLKKIRNYTCQICGELGFLQNNGKRYVETHHIIELHKLISGSYCSDNLVVVCANCHKKLHFARVDYLFVDNKQIMLRINGTQYQFSRNIISSK